MKLLTHQLSHDTRDLSRRAGMLVWPARLATVPVMAWRAIQRELRIARDISHLENMDDRELRDIGIDRWQIVDYVRGGARYGDDLDHREESRVESPGQATHWQCLLILTGLIVPSLLWLDGPANVLVGSLSAWLTDSAAAVSLALAMMVALLILVMAIGDPSTRYARLRHGATLVLASMLTSLAVAGLLKHLIGRARPAASGGDPWWFSPLAFDDRFASLPSAQASCVAAIAFSLALSLPRLKGALVLLGAAVGLARVLVGAHWLSDVLAGWALGTATVACLSAIARRAARRGGVAQDGGKGSEQRPRSPGV